MDVMVNKVAVAKKSGCASMLQTLVNQGGAILNAKREMNSNTVVNHYSPEHSNLQQQFEETKDTKPVKSLRGIPLTYAAQIDKPSKFVWCKEAGKQ